MTKPEVIEEAPISMSHLREELKNIKKRDGELSFRGTKTEEYLNFFNILKVSEVEELFAKMNKLGIPRFKENYIYKIIDIMPKDVNELKVILQGYSLNLSNENLNKIMAIIKDYLPDKKK